MSEAFRKKNRIESEKKERIALVVMTACGLALSGGVIISLVYLLMALASLLMVAPAVAQSVPPEPDCYSKPVTERTKRVTTWIRSRRADFVPFAKIESTNPR
jgi:hypothetical protein